MEDIRQITELMIWGDRHNPCVPSPCLLLLPYAHVRIATHTPCQGFLRLFPREKHSRTDPGTAGHATHTEGTAQYMPFPRCLTAYCRSQAVKVQIIQTLSMLINNIQNDTAVRPVPSS